uniref:Cell division control protein 73 C-terminal domain-containing protein n=1 Tax=Palpitomonas bilix TaxID=652834 RepID=A0A7S3DJ59_9EUKA|mmetsp:Transcript_37966/g.97993  ORF Transcript_37966/g.97993 Transcript_37966/m.97993 type:complete len:395 (+) Transcript_37966:272-1456(+)
MSFTSPLFLLRDFVTSQKLDSVSFDRDSNSIQFGHDGASFPADADTEYIAGDGKALSLKTIWFFAQQPPAKYAMACRNQNIPAVNFNERKALKDFLASKLETLDAISKKSSQSKRKAEAGESTLSKKQKAEEESGTKERALYTAELAMKSSKNFDVVFRILSDLARQEEKKRREEAGGVKHYDRYSQVQKEDATTAVDSAGTFKSKKRRGVTQDARPQQKESLPKPAPPPARAEPKQDKKNLLPIVIVPQAQTGLICKSNFKSLFEEGKYQSSKNLPSHSGPVIVTHRMSNGQTKHFKVMDDVERIRSAEWQLVVAVVVLGKSWQFKSWPSLFKSPSGDVDFPKLFSQVRGFYFQFEDDAPEKSVREWNVKVAKVSSSILPSNHTLTTPASNTS